MRSEDVWYGSDPCIDADSLPSWVYDYDRCSVCDKAHPDLGYDFAEYDIEVCDCVECETCGEWKSFEEFCNVAEICDSCYEKEDEKYQRERMERKQERNRNGK